MDFGLGVLAFLAVFVDWLGYSLCLVKTFGTSLVNLGFFILGGLRSRSFRLWLFFGIQHMLSAFYQVVCSFLHGGSCFFNYAIVRYSISGISSNLLYLVGRGRSSVSYFIK